MSTKSDKITTEESLLIITGMINEAKGHIRKNSFYYLLWGWTIMFANLAMFVLLQLNYHHAYLAWAITIPAWIITIVRAFISEKTSTVTTHFDEISRWLWLSFSVIIFTLVAFGWKINYQLNPVILLVTAIPTIVSGVILKFRPLIAGGIFFWLCGAASFLLSIETQPLVGAVAITVGYLVPGYLLARQK